MVKFENAEFFVQSKLGKKGTERPIYYDFQLDNEVDNIGWLTRNIHQAIYQVLKKRIGNLVRRIMGLLKGFLLRN